MERIKKIFLRVHIFLWILFGLLAALQFRQGSEPSWFRLTVGFMSMVLCTFYAHFHILNLYSAEKNKKIYFLRLLVIFLLAPFVYLPFSYKSVDTWDGFFEFYFTTQFSFVLIFLFLGWLARTTENLVINTFKKEELEKQAAETELHYLKSQINPHFLFNTLNNIHTLVYKQAATAPDAVMQLASLMRYMIYESNAPTVPLSREIQYLQDYISLQQLRYKQTGIVDLQTEGESASCRIAPLLFIHLLENAYKHSPSRLEPGDLKLRVLVKDDTLTFSMQNPIAKTPVQRFEEDGGIGLPNVRKRLALLYPNRHTIDIHNTGETFAVVLNIHGLQSQLHETKAELLHNR
jgi:LytS/YehU family sensor histidine kinase